MSRLRLTKVLTQFLMTAGTLIFLRILPVMADTLSTASAARNDVGTPPPTAVAALVVPPLLTPRLLAQALASGTIAICPSPNARLCA